MLILNQELKPLPLANVVHGLNIEPAEKGNFVNIYQHICPQKWLQSSRLAPCTEVFTVKYKAWIKALPRLHKHLLHKLFSHDSAGGYTIVHQHQQEVQFYHSIKGADVSNNCLGWMAK